MEVLACHQQPTLSQRSPSLLSRLSTLLKDSHPTTPRLPEKARRLLPPPFGTSRQDNGVNNSRAFTPWMKAAHVSLKRDVRIFPKKHPRYMQMSVPASTRILATFVSLSFSLSLLFLRPPFPENCCRFSRRKGGRSRIGSLLPTLPRGFYSRYKTRRESRLH